MLKNKPITISKRMIGASNENISIRTFFFVRFPHWIFLSLISVVWILFSCPFCSELPKALIRTTKKISFLLFAWFFMSQFPANGTSNPVWIMSLSIFSLTPFATKQMFIFEPSFMMNFKLFAAVFTLLYDRKQNKSPSVHHSEGIQ